METQPAGIRVIGAGLGRTGTTSLDAALNTLGMTPYHMRDVMGTAGHLDLWVGYMNACKAGDVAAILANLPMLPSSSLPALSRAYWWVFQHLEGEAKLTALPMARQPWRRRTP